MSDVIQDGTFLLPIQIGTQNIYQWTDWTGAGITTQNPAPSGIPGDYASVPVGGDLFEDFTALTPGNYTLTFYVENRSPSDAKLVLAVQQHLGTPISELFAAGAAEELSLPASMTSFVKETFNFTITPGETFIPQELYYSNSYNAPIPPITNSINPPGTTINVADVSLTAAPQATGTTVSGTEGAAISSATVATFTDANPNATASDFTATINWGDGTSTSGTVVAQNGGSFAVDGTHTYADEGKYAVSTTIKDVGGSTASTTSNASIADAALSAVAVGGQPETLFQSIPDLFSTPPNSTFISDVAGNQQMFDKFTLGSQSLVPAAGCAASPLPKSRLMRSMVRYRSDQRVLVMTALDWSGRGRLTHNSVRMAERGTTTRCVLALAS